MGKTFDSSASFTLSTGAMLSPDASWIAWENWNALSADDRRGFARIYPDFVVELLSPTDRLTDTMRKLEHWLEASAKLGWLIAPTTESVYIFEPGQPVRPIVGFDQELAWSVRKAKRPSESVLAPSKVVFRNTFTLDRGWPAARS